MATFNTTPDSYDAKENSTSNGSNSLSISVSSQNLPLQWTLNEEEHRLTIGGVELDGLYDDTQVLDIYLQFDQSNYEQQLEQNYDDAVAIPATLPLMARIPRS